MQAFATRSKKDRFTVCFTATADGKKYAPYIIFRRLKFVPEGLPKGVVGQVQYNGFQSEDTMLDYIKRVWAPGPASFGEKCIIALDQHHSHLTPAVKKAFAACNTTVVEIPAKATSKHQPMDLTINHMVKSKVCFKILPASDLNSSDCSGSRALGQVAD